HRPHPTLPPFPTRRSSDLSESHAAGLSASQSTILNTIDAFPEIGVRELARMSGISQPGATRHLDRLEDGGFVVRERSASDARKRSEEHTSELQSPYDLVCR